MFRVFYITESCHLQIITALLLFQFQFRSVQFSCSVVSKSLRPHESQHTRPPSPSPTPRVYSNSCLLSWWCHPAISSSDVPFSSCPQKKQVIQPFTFEYDRGLLLNGLYYTEIFSLCTKFVFTMNAHWLLSKIFSSSIGIIIWFLSLILYIILIDLWILISLHTWHNPS